jgi:hypothetical protein
MSASIDAWRHALSAFLLAGLGLLGCQKRPSSAECDRLLDHYVELLVQSDRPGTPGVELLRLQKETRAKAGQDRAFQTCSSDVSRSQYECAMSATSADRVEQCLLF